MGSAVSLRDKPAKPGERGIEIPTLKFTVKPQCEALRSGACTLLDLQCVSRFGIKIVRISETERGRTISSKDYPDARASLKAGYEVWVLPHLAENVIIEDVNTVALTLLQSFDLIYTVEDDSVHVREGTRLSEFMRHFNLCNQDLKVDYLPGCTVTYIRPRAASICTRPFAEHVLLHLAKAYWMSNSQTAFACLLRRQGIVQEDRLVLQVLNMRNNFAISPIAVVHGGCGPRGLWELPEKTSTILCPGDRLVFLPPAPLEENRFNERIASLNDETRSLTLRCAERSLDDANLFPGSAVKHGEPEVFPVPVSAKPKAQPKRKRPTRRGRGGSKKQNVTQGHGGSGAADAADAADRGDHEDDEDQHSQASIALTWHNSDDQSIFHHGLMQGNNAI